MIRVLLTSVYRLRYKKLIQESPELQQSIDQAIDRFKKNPIDTRLDVHPLRRSRQGTYALSVTDDIRIIFKYTAATTVYFLKIGTHPQVYPGYGKRATDN